MMNSAIGMRKSAMSSEEKRKWLFYAILSAAGTAGAAAILRDVRSNKRRAKKLDARHSKNAIVVPVPIKDFMKDLPSPADVAASKSDVAPSLESAAPASSGASYEMTPEEIAAKKRSILSGRKIDFFSKAAEGDGGAVPGKEKPADKPAGTAEEKSKEKPEEDEGESHKEDTPEPAAPRDQLGRFVSPTDPVGVAHAEKSAQFSSLLKPLGGPEDLLGAAMNRPLAASVGILGSVVLAAEISKAIRERRKEKSKKLMEEAQNQYASLIGGGSEKTAQIEKRSGGSLASLIGEAGGYALFVPAALAAIVTHKIISNRKKDKLAAKDKNNSYPDDPMIFYETKMGEAKPISAETALMMIMTKRAMIEDIERAYAERGELEKKAQAAPLFDRYDDKKIDKSVEFLVDRLLEEGNRDKLLGVIKKLHAGENVNWVDEMAPFVGWWGIPKRFSAHANTPEFKAKLAGNKRLNNALASLFQNDPKFKAFRDNAVEQGMSDWAANGNWFSNMFGGFEKGGLMHQIMMWLAKTFGMGAARARFDNAVSGKLDEARNDALGRVGLRKDLEALNQKINGRNDADPSLAAEGADEYDAMAERMRGATGPEADAFKKINPSSAARGAQTRRDMQTFYEEGMKNWDNLSDAEREEVLNTGELLKDPSQIYSENLIDDAGQEAERDAKDEADLRIDEDLQANNIADAKERAMEEANTVQAAQQEAENAKANLPVVANAKGIDSPEYATALAAAREADVAAGGDGRMAGVPTEDLSAKGRYPSKSEFDFKDKPIDAANISGYINWANANPSFRSELLDYVSRNASAMRGKDEYKPLLDWASAPEQGDFMTSPQYLRLLDEKYKPGITDWRRFVSSQDTRRIAGNLPTPRLRTREEIGDDEIARLRRYADPKMVERALMTLPHEPTDGIPQAPEVAANPETYSGKAPDRSGSEPDETKEVQLPSRYASMPNGKPYAFQLRRPGDSEPPPPPPPTPIQPQPRIEVPQVPGGVPTSNVSRNAPPYTPPPTPPATGRKSPGWQGFANFITPALQKMNDVYDAVDNHFKPNP